MKCEDIRLQLAAMAKGELSPELAGTVKNHLSNCAGCALEYQDIKAKTALLGKARPHGKAPDYLEDRIRQRFKQRYGRRTYVPKAAVAALLVLGILSTVYVQATTGFFTDLDLLNRFTFGDRGIEHSLRQGAGQLIDEEKTVGDVTVNLHSLVADGNRTVALFSIDGPAEADFARIQTFRITDAQGRVLGQAGGFIYSDGKVTGNIETVSADQLGKKINVEFSGIQYGKVFSLKDLAIDPQGQYPRVIVLEQGLGELTIEDLVINGDKLTMEMTTDFKDSHFQSPMLALYQDGVLLRNDQSLMSENRIQSTWTLNDPHAELRMDMEYRKTLVAVDEAITFSVKVDRKMVEQHTMVQELDKEAELESGLIMNIRRIIATSSQVVIEIGVEGNSPGREILPDGLDLSVRADGSEVDFSQDYDYQERMHRIKLDPTVPLDKLELIVHGYYLVREGAEQYSLTPASEGSEITFHGITLLVEEIDATDSDMVRFRLRAVDNPMLLNSAALIVDGQKTEPINLSSWQPWNDEKTHRFDIIFPSRGMDNWTMELGPVWQEYRNSNMTIQVP